MRARSLVAITGIDALSDCGLFTIVAFTTHAQSHYIFLVLGDSDDACARQILDDLSRVHLRHFIKSTQP